MLTIVTAMLAASGGMPITKPVRILPPVCQQVEARKADGSALYDSGNDNAPAARPLTEEPPADVVAAVLYAEGACSKPIVISRGVGAQRTGK